jgi:hypothetical protein
MPFPGIDPDKPAESQKRARAAVNRHNRISHLYGTLLTVHWVLEKLEFDSPQEAMRWLADEFVNVELDWHNLGAGSPYPEGLPNVVRSIEQALGTSLEREIGTAWGDLSSSQRQIADSNFHRIFGEPELMQRSNSEYCSHKFERWLVFLEDGLAALDASQQDIHTRAAAILAVQGQIAQRRTLAERAEFRDHFNAQVRSLREEIGQLTAPALAKRLASTFLDRSIGYHLFDIGVEKQGIYYYLVLANPAATDLIHAAIRIAGETKDFPLTATLLLIVWGRRPKWPALVEAGVAHPDMARTLEGSEPRAARWWRSVTRAHDHEVRLAWHEEYNLLRAYFLSELAPLASVDRLRRILANDEWHLGALPAEYADPAALEALSRAERATLRQRLTRAPRGAWFGLKARA